LLLSQTTFDDFLILKTFAFQFIVRALRQLSSITTAQHAITTAQQHYDSSAALRLLSMRL
jgi:hypothetical protein